MVISETEPITESKVEEESNLEDITEAPTEQDQDNDKNGTLDISAKKGDTVKVSKYEFRIGQQSLRVQNE